MSNDSGNNEGQSAAVRRRPLGLPLGTLGGVPIVVQPIMVLLVPLLGYGFASVGLGSQTPSVARILGGCALVVAVYLTVFCHEAAHALMARRLRLGVSSIVLGAFGGSTALNEEPATPRQTIAVSIVGPIVSIVLGGGFLLLWTSATGEFWVRSLEALIWANLVVGVMNLIPALPLDGGQILQAFVWGATGNRVRGTIVTVWAGRVIAIALVAAAFVSLQVDWRGYGSSFFIAFAFFAIYIWIGSAAAIARVRIRRRLPNIQARPLARGALAVPEDLPIAEAVRRAQEVGAGGIVLHTSDDRLTGIVSEAALLAIPEERRPWMPISTVSRNLSDGLVLPADIGGEDLILAISRSPSDEYVLIEPDGEIYGVLATIDVDRAFAATSNKGRHQARTLKESPVE